MSSVAAWTAFASVAAAAAVPGAAVPASCVGLPRSSVVTRQCFELRPAAAPKHSCCPE